MWPPSPRQDAIALKAGRVDRIGTRKLAPKLRKAALLRRGYVFRRIQDLPSVGPVLSVVQVLC
jgi:hypothetical protein